ncbi:MAG: hypothetical protein ACJ8OJ_03715 [Povalibacter sp.]
MKYLHRATVLFLFLGSTAMAETFTGTQPMVCKPSTGHDCLPTEKSCTQLKPEPGKDLTMRIDVEKMTLKTPYRNDTMPISSFGFNKASLVLQGTSLEIAWSATVNRTSGKLTLAIADREGAYVIFGQCQLDTAPPAKTP